MKTKNILLYHFNILSFYTSAQKNHDYILYCSWDMAHDGCNCCFSFGATFCLFTSLAAQKVKISKQWKKTPGDIILHKCTKIMIIYMLYCPWDMAHDTCNCYFLFWAIFFPFYPPRKQNLKKNEKISWRYHHFTRVPKIIRWYMVPEIWWATGGRMEKVTHRAGCTT